MATCQAPLTQSATRPRAGAHQHIRKLGWSRSRWCFSITTTQGGVPIEPNLIGKRKWWDSKRFRLVWRRNWLDEIRGSPILGVSKSRHASLFLYRRIGAGALFAKLPPVSLGTLRSDGVGAIENPAWSKVPIGVGRGIRFLVGAAFRVNSMSGGEFNARWASAFHWAAVQRFFVMSHSSRDRPFRWGGLANSQALVIAWSD